LKQEFYKKMPQVSKCDRFFLNRESAIAFFLDRESTIAFFLGEGGRGGLGLEKLTQSLKSTKIQ